MRMISSMDSGKTVGLYNLDLRAATIPRLTPKPQIKTHPPTLSSMWWKSDEIQLTASWCPARAISFLPRNLLTKF